MEKLYFCFGFLNYKQTDKDELRQEIKKRSNLAIGGLISITIVAILFCLSYGVGFFKWMKTSFAIIPITCFFVYTLTSLICYAIGIKRNWIPESTPEGRVVEAIKEGNNNVIQVFKDEYSKGVTQVIKRCVHCEKYSDARLLLSELIGRYNNHQKFVNYYHKAIHSPERDLNCIHEEFSQSSGYVKLLCVLSNTQYYDSKDGNEQLRTLTDYFISFYPALNLGGRRIKRVFSKSVIMDKDIINHEKSRWLLQYLWINIITGVEAYLLVDERELNCHVDYVIGKYADSSLALKNKAYFSFEDEEGKYPDGTITSNDQLLLSVLEEDFYNRLYGLLKKNNQKRKIIDVRKANSFLEVCGELQLSLDDVGEIGEVLEKQIQSCNCAGITGEHKSQLVKLLHESYFRCATSLINSEKPKNTYNPEKLKSSIKDSLLDDVHKKSIYVSLEKKKTKKRNK